MQKDKCKCDIAKRIDELNSSSQFLEHPGISSILRCVDRLLEARKDVHVTGFANSLNTTLYVTFQDLVNYKAEQLLNFMTELNHHEPGSAKSWDDGQSLTRFYHFVWRDTSPARCVFQIYVKAQAKENAECKRVLIGYQSQYPSEAMYKIECLGDSPPPQE